jgi:hypothetical protein
MYLAHERAYLRLTDALARAVSEGRIGVPRFVRWHDRLEEGVSLNDAIAAGTTACTRVFGAKPIREHRTGDHLFHTTVHAVWASGASALISAGPSDIDDTAGPEIMLLGSSGAVYFDGVLADAPAPTRNQIRQT